MTEQAREKKNNVNIIDIEVGEQLEEVHIEYFLYFERILIFSGFGLPLNGVYVWYPDRRLFVL